MQNNIEKFLQYDGDYAKQWLAQSVNFTIAHNKNDKLISTIFNLSNIETDINTFLADVEKYMKEDSDAKYDKKRSPEELQKHIITWVYYSVFWAFDLKEVNKKNNRKYQLITYMALQFHYHYLQYITRVDEESRINIKSLEYAAMTVGRAIEILAKIAQQNSAYLSEKYFPANKDDLFHHFINIIENDYVEKECYFIKKNTEGSHEIFIKYENSHIGVDFQLLPSRRLSKGSNSTENNDSIDENNKITQYLLQGSLEYEKIVNLEKGKRANKNKSKANGRHYDHVTQTEKLEKDNAGDRENAREESIEDNMQKYPKIRASLSSDIETIPDQFRQRMINRAMSSSIAKQNRMSSSTYEIPPMENLSIFIQYLSNNVTDQGATKRNFYISIFILSLFTGRPYLEIIYLLIDGKINGCTVNTEKKLFSLQFDNKIFGSVIEDFSMNNGKKISFHLPEGIALLFVSLKKQILLMTSNAREELYENEKEYIKCIKQERDLCPVYINIDFNNTWKILAVYSQNYYENNLASLFCIGKYTTIDRSALSYTSTHKSGQIHSHFLIKIYSELGMNNLIKILTGSDEIDLDEKVFFDKKMEYVGSSRVVEIEESKKFFSKMRRAILREEDPIKYFNLYAVYARYALSILLGTRYGRVSCNLKYISLELNVLRIIEKADDKQSAVRFIPLCKQAKTIIKKYKSLCSELGLPDDDIFFIKKKKNQLLFGNNKTILANMFSHEYDLDDHVLDFIRKVPLNFGRHIVHKVAVEQNFNMYYVKTLMGHYSKGTEQLGMASTIDTQDYIIETSRFLGKIGRLYGV